jgi:hypothetical protein
MCAASSMGSSCGLGSPRNHHRDRLVGASRQMFTSPTQASIWR